MALSDETRKEIFEKIRSALQKFSPPMTITKDDENVFELIGNKPVPYRSKKEIVPGMYFSCVVARKDMISFYFFPIYFHTDDYVDLIPTMYKCLKGKTCFNIKKTEQVNEKELTGLLKKGVHAWKKMGYMK